MAVVRCVVQQVPKSFLSSCMPARATVIINLSNISPCDLCARARARSGSSYIARCSFALKCLFFSLLLFLHVKNPRGPSGLCRAEVCGPAIGSNEPLYTQENIHIYLCNNIYCIIIYIYLQCIPCLNLIHSSAIIIIISLYTRI